KAAASRAQAKAPAGRRLAVHTTGTESAAPRPDAGGSPAGVPPSFLASRGEMMGMLGLTGGSAAVTSPTPDSSSKLSAASPGGEIADLSWGAPRLKSRLSSPPPVPAKRQREVGSSDAEEVGVAKRGRIILSSDSNDDGATLTLIRRKRSARCSQSGGGVLPLPVLGVAPDGPGSSSVPIAPASEEVRPADGGGIPMTVEEEPRSPGVSTAQRGGSATDLELDALTPENVELVTTRTLAQVCHIWVLFFVFSTSSINADPLLYCLTRSYPSSGPSTLTASRV
ncbi:hypothetical protein PanWU01x14_320580, partial [Parasponia andersonii]